MSEGAQVLEDQTLYLFGSRVRRIIEESKEPLNKVVERGLSTYLTLLHWATRKNQVDAGRSGARLPEEFEFLAEQYTSLERLADDADRDQRYRMEIDRLIPPSNYALRSRISRVNLFHRPPLTILQTINRSLIAYELGQKDYQAER